MAVAERRRQDYLQRQKRQKQRALARQGRNRAQAEPPMGPRRGMSSGAQQSYMQNLFAGRPGGYVTHNQARPQRGYGQQQGYGQGYRMPRRSLGGQHEAASDRMGYGRGFSPQAAGRYGGRPSYQQNEMMMQRPQGGYGYQAPQQMPMRPQPQAQQGYGYGMQGGMMPRQFFGGYGGAYQTPQMAYQPRYNPYQQSQMAALTRNQFGPRSYVGQPWGGSQAVRRW